MTTHIDRVVSEVIPEPEVSESGEAPDRRWHDQENYQAMTARCERLMKRVAAEGFDD